MLDILRQQIVRWAETVVPHGKDANVELGDGLWLALHVDGGMNTVQMLRAMMDGDHDYVIYGHFMIDLEKGKTVDWRPERMDYRYATEDEEADAFLKLIAAMA